MIYLFDDKKNRQSDYRWNAEKFMLYSDILIPIYHYNEVKELGKRLSIFSKGNTILFHESFFDTDFNRHEKEAIEIRRELEEFAQEHSNFYLAFFSGSKSSRMLNGNIAYLPVSILYQNLESFLIKAKEGLIDLNYILYGKNSSVEQDLIDKLVNVNSNLLKDCQPLNAPIDSSILIARTITNDRLPQIVFGAKYHMNLSGDSDIDFHNLILRNLNDEKYQKIFIPLCFGTTMSDFNGLRLATHIRCTDSINKLTEIYIYSFVNIENFINSEYFNILKTKNVQLINYSVKAFEEVIKLVNEPFDLNELSDEVAKLKLDVPVNYEDGHSIANEWAVYRWAQAINADNQAIEGINKKIYTQLYFKYLRTIYPISKMSHIGEDNLKLKDPGQPKILYVDDDAEKGWYEILIKILSDVNSIECFDYLGDEIKKISQEEIIQKTISKVFKDDIDIVILDFRLHPDDFITKDIEEITGFKLLKEIKSINPGIQVIIFSATSKIWNFQALQREKADGFVIKETPELSKDSEFTHKAIYGLLSNLNLSIKIRFLKGIWKKIVSIKSYFQSNELFNDEYKQFIFRLEHNLDIAFRLLSETKYSNKYFSYAYMQLFQIIEDFANLSFVFKQQDDDCYVIVKGEEVLVRKSISDNKIELALKFKDGKYVIEKDVLSANKKGNQTWIETNFRISALLIFRLGFENSSFLKWTKIYTKRNKGVAHFDNKYLLHEKDIYELLNFIENIINPNSQNDSNSQKGLEKRSFDESIHNLREKYKN